MGAIFAISTIPAAEPNGRAIPAWLELTAAALAVLMLPTCAVLPAPLLLGGRRHLKHIASAKPVPRYGPQLHRTRSRGGVLVPGDAISSDAVLQPHPAKLARPRILASIRGHGRGH